MNRLELVAAAIQAHEVFRVHGNPVRPAAWECVSCGHMARDRAERMEHRASSVLAALDLEP